MTNAALSCVPGAAENVAVTAAPSSRLRRVALDRFLANVMTTSVSATNCTMDNLIAQHKDENKTGTYPRTPMAKKQTIKRRGRPVRLADNALDRQQIVSSVVALIDRDGLDGFSLRGAKRTAGRSRSHRVSQCCKAVPHRRRLDRLLRELFRRYPMSLHRHPNIAPLLGAQLVSNSGVNPKLVEQILAVLKAPGFRGLRLIETIRSSPRCSGSLRLN